MLSIPLISADLLPCLLLLSKPFLELKDFENKQNKQYL